MLKYLSSTRPTGAKIRNAKIIKIHSLNNKYQLLNKFFAKTIPKLYIGITAYLK